MIWCTFCISYLSTRTDLYFYYFSYKRKTTQRVVFSFWQKMDRDSNLSKSKQSSGLFDGPIQKLVHSIQFANGKLAIESLIPVRLPAIHTDGIFYSPFTLAGMPKHAIMKKSYLPQESR